MSKDFNKCFTIVGAINGYALAKPVALNTNYLNFIRENALDSRKAEELKSEGRVVEIHHIIPRSCFLESYDDTEDNKVRLTTAAHAYAHILFDINNPGAKTSCLPVNTLRKAGAIGANQPLEDITFEQVQGYEELRKSCLDAARETFGTLEHAQKVAVGNMGKVMSHEARTKMSEAHKGLSNVCAGRKWMTLKDANGDVRDRKRVRPEDVDVFLNNGYTLEGNHGHATVRGLVEPYIPEGYEGKVGQFTLEGQFVKAFDSCFDAERATGVSKSVISQCVNGISHTGGGCQWRIC